MKDAKLPAKVKTSPVFLFYLLQLWHRNETETFSADVCSCGRCGRHGDFRRCYLKSALWYAVQLVVGEDQVSEVDQALEVRVVQRGEAVGVQVEGVEVLEVGEGVRSDLTDGVSAQRQVDLQEQEVIKNTI